MFFWQQKLLCPDVELALAVVPQNSKDHEHSQFFLRGIENLGEAFNYFSKHNQ